MPKYFLDFQTFNSHFVVASVKQAQKTHQTESEHSQKAAL